MSEREDPIIPIQDPPASGDSNEPQEAPGADPALDRDDDDPNNGPIGDRPTEQFS